MPEKCRLEASQSEIDLDFLVGLGEQLARSMYPPDTLAIQTEPESGTPIALEATEIPPEVYRHFPVPLCEAGTRASHWLEYMMTFDQSGQRAVIPADPALALIFSRDSRYSHSVVVYEVAYNLCTIVRNADCFRFAPLTDEGMLDVMLSSGMDEGGRQSDQTIEQEVLQVEPDELTALAEFVGGLVARYSDGNLLQA